MTSWSISTSAAARDPSVGRICLLLNRSGQDYIKGGTGNEPAGMDHVQESQEPVFAFLANPATHGGAQVKRVDTHAAVLFLTPKRVFKVKRAVQFPFLDFSTLEKRKAACESE